ncbi:MAG: hypothetical protein H6P95_2454 [Candidatus Aminicenantes bacterium]|jgi:hypothetical protein|nr:hypothetical protein [Candidatus Aminicenantes bacterium]
MKRTAAIATVLAAVLAGGMSSSAAGADRAALAKKQDALTAEYGLAKEAKFYFVFDVLGRKIELRVRGMVLRTWPVAAMRFWGRPEFAGTVELVKKTTLKAPERIVLKPGDTEPSIKVPTPKPGVSVLTATAADYDLEALELKDMPGRFSLDLDNGLRITVKTLKGQAPGLGARLRDGWRWYVSLPLADLFGERKGKPLSELELTLVDEKDAQSVYWHLFDGIKGIIL